MVFLGTHVNGVDAKGRVSAPAEFRAVVRQEGLEAVYCRPSFDGPFLVGCGEALMGRLKQSVDAMDPLDPERDDLARAVFGDTRLLSFDANGRITLPAAFIAHAELDGQASFVGLGDRFEIWSPQAYENRRDAARAALRARAGGQGAR